MFRPAALLFSAAAFIAAASAANATTYFLYTGQSGAQTQIDSTHTSTWTYNLSAGQSFDLGGGYFDMKDGSQTTASLSLSIYEDSGSTPVAQVTLTQADFATLHQTADGATSPDDQSFNGANQYTPILFTLPYTLDGGDSGHSFTINLTSDASGQQSAAYFIKGASSVAVLDSPTGSQPTGLTNTTVVTDVPEPISLALLTTGLAGLSLARRRARR